MIIIWPSYGSTVDDLTRKQRDERERDAYSRFWGTLMLENKTREENAEIVDTALDTETHTN